MDLQKAFDTVNHSILLDKLTYYEVRGQTKKWFENWITERYQYTSIEECSLEKITNGVPHRSILGPLLAKICHCLLESLLKIISYLLFNPHL